MADNMMDAEDKVLLARIDERTTFIVNQVSELKKSYVTKEEFKPVRMIVYGLAGAVLLTFLYAIVNLVVTNKKANLNNSLNKPSVEQLYHVGE